MAIYHLHLQHFSRGKGHSSVGAAAYRSGSKLRSEKAEYTFDYTRKQGIEAEGVRLAGGAPDRLLNRETLWNEVETKAETRKNSRLASELEGAIPRELSQEQRQKLVDGFIEKEITSAGAAADFAIHTGRASDGGENPHVHIMFTTRAVDADGWAKGKIRQWQAFDQKQQLHHWREAWAEHCNAALEDAQSSARIDHRSLKDQGIERLPQVHMGKDAWHTERKGVATERGDRMPEEPRREMRHRLAVQRWLSAGVQKAAKARSAFVEYLNRREWGRERGETRDASRGKDQSWREKETDRDNQRDDRGPDFER